MSAQEWSRPAADTRAGKGPSGPGIKNEMLLPAVLDPWAACALYEAATGCDSSGQQGLAGLARPQGQAAATDDDRGAEDEFRAGRHRRTDRRLLRWARNRCRAGRCDRRNPRVGSVKAAALWRMGVCARGAGITLQIVGERLGIMDQFQGVDRIDRARRRLFEVLERVEGGKHQVSICAGAPAVFGWATGNLPEPRNNPQVGMANMRTIMPALQKAKTAALETNSLSYISVSLPSQQRTTRVVKDLTADEIARELIDWIGKEASALSL